MAQTKINLKRQINTSGQSYVFAYRSASNQTISNTTVTTVIFNSEIEDTLGEYNISTGIFTATEDGVYQVVANIHWAGVPSGQWVQTYITAGGTVYTMWYDTIVATISQKQADAKGIFKLAAGDTVEIKVQQNSGGNLDIRAFAYTTSLFITKIS